MTLASMRRTSLDLACGATLRAAFTRPAALPAKFLLALCAAVNLDIAARKRVAIRLTLAVWTSRISCHGYLPSFCCCCCCLVPRRPRGTGRLHCPCHACRCLVQRMDYGILEAAIATCRISSLGRAALQRDGQNVHRRCVRCLTCTCFPIFTNSALDT